MKKVLLTALTIGIVAFTPLIGFAQEESLPNIQTISVPKEVYVNLDAVLTSSDKIKQTLEKLTRETGKQIAILKKDLDYLEYQYSVETDEEIKAKRKEEMESKKAELERLAEEQALKIEESKKVAQAEFIGEIRPIINDVRQDNGYLIIHRLLPNQILSIDPTLDKTPQVIEAYNTYLNEN